MTQSAVTVSDRGSVLVSVASIIITVTVITIKINNNIHTKASKRVLDEKSKSAFRRKEDDSVM